MNSNRYKEVIFKYFVVNNNFFLSFFNKIDSNIVRLDIEIRLTLMSTIKR